MYTQNFLKDGADLLVGGRAVPLRQGGEQVDQEQAHLPNNK